MRQKPSSFEGGSTAGEHPAVRRLELFVAPSIGDEGFNTIHLPLVVVACWRMNHALFDFGSSFVTPETKAELPLLARIVDAHPGCPAAIFGHADPTGDDEHNKRLSGRRARAIHALLTRDVGAWEDLFSTSTNGDSWGLPSTQRILMHLVRKDRGAPYLLGPATGRVDAPFDAAVRAFQVDQGLTSDGIAGPLTRKALYAAYMDDLCLGPERRFVLENEAFVVGDPLASWKRGGGTTIDDWGKTMGSAVTALGREAETIRATWIAEPTRQWMGWEAGSGMPAAGVSGVGEVLHDSFIPEYGWEFLPG